uniref:Uncharacterized protein n=1 Tax=Picea glauca TaxID=3330 RepID=A0A117NIH7_PICGL|nr:hypothetical protein ABT39_MTgene3155 [Picea glauca]QHR89043.1 hypothetical protein Q903MT_gene3062 [Picea sitchensis]
MVKTRREPSTSPGIMGVFPGDHTLLREIIDPLSYWNRVFQGRSPCKSDSLPITLKPKSGLHSFFGEDYA